MTPGGAPVTRICRSERGSVLIIAVIAMLIMGVLTVSFALLADIEARIGFNYKQQAQAEALAEAGLAAAQDAVRSAVTASNGFTAWLNTVVVGGATGNPGTGVALGGGEYWARVDNDCYSIGTAYSAGPPVMTAWFPKSIQESSTCVNTTDTNKTAVITAWATAGAGRSRVRVIVGVDSAWNHVCASIRSSGYCPDDEKGGGGTPNVFPSDPSDPNGPAVYNDLPHPPLGCSQIDPTMHNSSSGACTIQSCPYPYAACTALGTRLVITGDSTKQACNDPGGGATYSGYFDCALSTPCTFAGCPNGPTQGCLKPGDTRVAGSLFYKQTSAFDPCPTGATGMVFNWYSYPAGTGTTRAAPPSSAQTPSFAGTFGTPSPLITATPNYPQTSGVNIYVVGAGGGHGGGTATVGPGNTYVFGTLVVEGAGGHTFTQPTGGTGSASCGSNADLTLGSHSYLYTATNAYGYPLAVVLYDPTQAPPTGSGGQNTCADFGAGGGNTEIHGAIYGSGDIFFNPINIFGPMVAYMTVPQGSGTYTYTGEGSTYGNAAPPAGFPVSGGVETISLIRKSFVTCAKFVNEGTSGTPRSSC